MGVARCERILLIGRHFWPHGSIDAAGHLIELATGLRLSGLHVTVLTPKYSAAWSDRLQFREIDVERPLRLFRSGWTARGDRTASRYIRYLTDWVEQHAARFDLVYCDSAREESVAAVAAARRASIPSVVRLAGNGDCSDLEFFAQAKIGKRCRAAAIDADALVIGDPLSQRRWIAETETNTSIHRIPIGVGPTFDQASNPRDDLRRSLARINGDLHVPDSNSVVLSTERLTTGSGVKTLASAAYSLAEHIEGLSFWFVGDGPQRDTIFNELRANGLRQSTAMPGSFALMNDIFVAADLMVQTGDEGFDSQIPTAVAAGLPIVIADTPVARQFFNVTPAEVRDAIDSPAKKDAATDSNHPTPGLWWFHPQRPGTLRRAIADITSNHEMARSRARQLRRTLQMQRPQSDSIGRYVRLFHELIIENKASAGGKAPAEEIG